MAGTLNQDDYDGIAKSLGSVLNSNKPAAGGNSGGGGASGAPSAGFFTGVVDGLSKVRNGASASGEGLNSLAGIISKVSAPLGAAAAQQAQAIQATRGSMNDLNQQGANFGGNISKFNKSLADAGSTPESFVKQFQAAGGRLQGLGSTGGEAANNLLSAQKDFKDRYGEQMTKMGLTNDQQNEYLAKYLADRKFTDMADKKSRTALIDEAGNNANELAKFAQTTGKSVDQLQKEQMASTENMDVQAEILMGGEKMQQAYSRINTQIADMGPGIKSLTDEIISGGVRTEEGSAKFAALGNAGVELERAVLAQKNASTAGEKIEADRMLAKAKIAVNEQMMSKEYLQNVQADKSAVGAAQKQMLKENMGQISAMQQAKQQLEKMGKPSDAASVTAYMEKLSKANINQVDPATGKPVASSNAVQAGNALDARSQNEAITLSSKGTALAIDGLGAAAKRASSNIGGTLYRSPSQTTAGSGQAPQDVRPERKQITRDFGTLGMTGDLFEKSNFMGKIQKGESVMTADQIQNLVKGAQSQVPQMPDMSKMPNLADINKKMAMSMPSPKDLLNNLQSKFSGIGTSISSTKATETQKADKAALKEATPAKPSTETPAIQDAASTATLDDLLTSVNDLNKTMHNLVDLGKERNNLAESMNRKVSSNNRFTA